MALGPQVTHGPLLCPVTHLACLARLGTPGKEGWLAPPVDRSASPTLPTCLWRAAFPDAPQEGPLPRAGSPRHPASRTCPAPGHHLVTWAADTNPRPLQAAQSSSPCRSIAGRVNLSQCLGFKLHVRESENLERQRILQLGGTEQPAAHLAPRQGTASAPGPGHLPDPGVVPILPQGHLSFERWSGHSAVVWS